MISAFTLSLVAVILAEMGDKTQLMTISLAAEEAVKIGGTGWLAKVQQIAPVWMGTTCGMMVADTIGIIVGIVLHKKIPEKLVKWIAASCFAIFGLLGMHESLDSVLSQSVTIHHIFLIMGMILLPLLMWLIAKVTKIEPQEFECEKIQSLS